VTVEEGSQCTSRVVAVGEQETSPQMGKDPRHTVLARLARIVARDADRLPLGQRLCTAVVDLLGVEGAVLTFGYEEPARLTVWASDETASWLDGIQEVLGEGPGWEAFQSGEIVTTELKDSGRWALFSRAAEAEVGHLTLHAVPMRPGGQPMGVMLLYQSGERPVIDTATAQVLANAVGAALLRTPSGTVEDLDGPWRARSAVHQAVGMVMAQLGISSEDALVLLRAHAYAHDATLDAIANQIIDRKLDFKYTDTDPEDS
jgi:hypothetical protein